MQLLIHFLNYSFIHVSELLFKRDNIVLEVAGYLKLKWKLIGNDYGSTKAIQKT